jgi:hypothetical protein
MISFERLGYFGRLGNQMFQYAALIGFATHSNQKWGIPKRNSEEIEIGGLGYKERFVLNDMFDLNYETEITPQFNFMENGTLVSLPENTNIHGYFQNSDYFEHCKDIVRKEFSFKDTIKDKVQHFVDSLNVDGLVSVHVRRGDYVTLSDCHPPQSKEYYLRGMSEFEDKTPLIISDDIEWCKETFGNDYSYSEMDDMYEDMCLMSLCDAHVLSNSSFSWWGAWLGGGPSVAPKKWFGRNHPNFNDVSIYEKDWILI